MRELRDELEVPGHVNMYKTKTRKEWIAQARKAMADAEKYGATTPNEMKEEERSLLREALEALGQDVRF